VLEDNGNAHKRGGVFNYAIRTPQPDLACWLYWMAIWGNPQIGDTYMVRGV
jgi:hypothetical protein